MSEMRIAANTNTAASKSSEAGGAQDAGSQDAFSSVMADATQRNAANTPPAASDAPATAESAVKDAKSKSTDAKDSKDTNDDEHKDASDATSTSAATAVDGASQIDPSIAALVQSLPLSTDRASLQIATTEPTLIAPKDAALPLTARAPDLVDFGAASKAASQSPAVAGAKAKPVAVAAELFSAADSTRPSAAANFDTDMRAALEHAAVIGDKLSASASGATRSELPQLSAAMAALSSAVPTTIAAAATQFSVAAPVTSAAFADDFSQRVMFMAGHRIQSAEISVSPPDLGPISVKIDMRGNEASVSFNAANATTRSALQDALPRLQSMFETSGLQLSNASVGSDTRRDASNSRRDGRPESGAAAIGAINASGSLANAAAVTTSISTRSVRLVDTFV